jgi:type III restriction enzyme
MMYFVVESKGTIGVEFLRPSEKGKITCGQRHFEELSKQAGHAIELIVASDIDDESYGVDFETIRITEKILRLG